MDASPQTPSRSRRQAAVAAAGWVLRLVQLAALGVLLSLAAHHAGQRLRRAKFAALAAASASAAVETVDRSDDDGGSDDATPDAAAVLSGSSNDTTFTDAFSGAQLIASLRAATGWDAHAALRVYRRLPLRPAALPDDVVAAQARTRTGANLTVCYATPYRPRAAPGMAAALLRARAAVAYSGGARARAKRRACRALKRAAFPYRRSDCPPDRVCLPSEPGRESAREHLRPRGTDYLGELGYELLAITPWAAELALHRFLGRSVSAADSHPFYFFSPLHCEAGASFGRGFRSLADMVTSWPHDDDANKQLVNALVTPAAFPLRNWRLPPYTAHYCGAGLTWFSGAPYVVVLNKRSTGEWRTGRSLNTIPVAGLLALYDALVARGYTVVYHRALPGLYASEAGGFRPELDDFTALEAHAAAAGSSSSLVLLPQFLAAMAAAEAEADAADGEAETVVAAGADDSGDEDEGGDGTDAGDRGDESGGPRHLQRRLALSQAGAAPAAAATQSQRSPQRRPRRLSINELQLSVLADADGHVAVQGGPSYLSLIWGARRPVLLYQVGGREVALNATAWFPHISGSVVRTARNVPALLAGAAELFPRVGRSGGARRRSGKRARAASPATQAEGGGSKSSSAPAGDAG
jgi:hypothetical protein